MRLFCNPLRKIIPDGGLTAIFRTVGFIGDSLSSGEHESTNEDGSKGFNDYYEYSWGQFIARKCGLTAYNFSRGGLTAKSFLQEYNPTNDCFVQEKACQAYCIALGVNDTTRLCGKIEYSNGFGEWSDVDWQNCENNGDSFIGYYVKIIQKLRQLQPKCRIFVVTPCRERPLNSERKYYYEKISAFLRELANKLNYVYVIDLMKYAPTYNKRFGKKYYCGGHMSAAGYKFTADMISTYIDWIIRHNVADFTQVGFIGKDVHNAHEKW